MLSVLDKTGTITIGEPIVRNHAWKEGIDTARYAGILKVYPEKQ